MAGSSLTSNKPLKVFTGKDFEDSVENYVNVVIANLLLNIGPESTYTLLLIVANKINHENVLNDHIEIIHKIQIDKNLINLLWK